ncbi:MAG: hypothetical protein IJM26_08040 [Lachnospiraceae bacterium]|nr:hypothetical protein [Lachnospiraceae bacterium]MBR0153718.1 hypothetical protein [Lachnospiraceae bacterium]
MEKENLEISRYYNEIAVINSRIAELKGQIAQCNFLQKGKKRTLEKELAGEQERMEFVMQQMRDALAEKAPGEEN